MILRVCQYSSLSLTGFTGRAYRDYYLVVCENQRIDSWSDIRRKLKSFFQTYFRRVNWHTALPSHHPCPCHPLKQVIQNYSPSNMASDNTKPCDPEKRNKKRAFLGNSDKRGEGSDKRSTIDNNRADENCCFLAEENPYLVGRNSTAENGNFLEMVNLAISVLDCDYVDRSLETTGEKIVGRY